MAEESSGEKTEEPTQKRLRDAAEEGNVPYSKDFTQTVLVVAFFSYIVGGASRIMGQLTEMILMPVTLLRLSEVDFLYAVNTALTAIFFKAIWVFLPFILILMILGMLTDLVQVGFILAFKKLIPKGDKLNAVKNLKNIFSKDNFVEFLKSCGKIAFLSVLLWFLLKDAMPALVLMPQAGFLGMGEVTGQLLKKMIIYVGLVYLVISIFDLIWKRYSHKKQLMMTIQEVEREYKETEGSPQIKQSRRAFHEELLQGDPVSSSQDASVVVTNPTHLAVALQYNQDTPLPIVIGKGSGIIAEQMMAAAREAGVPVIRNIPLARALTYYVRVGHYISSEFIEPVAELLKLVREIKAKSVKYGGVSSDDDELGMDGKETVFGE